MNARTKITSLVLLLSTLTLAGCAADVDAPSPTPPSSVDDYDDDAVVADSTVAAAATDEEEAAVADVVDPELAVAPEEASDPFIDHSLDDSELIDDVDGTPIPPLTETETKATSKCKKATGYRSGSKFTICVTTINGKRVEVNTARAYLRMRSAAAKKGVSLYVVSGFRTMAEQQYLYNCYRTKKCNGGNLAAKPGYSNHQSGHALDLNTSAKGVYSYLKNHGSSYRFKRTVPSEAWHWEHW